MKKVFTGNILFLISINLLIKPFYSLVIDTTVQNRIGPEEYGLFLALFNFVYIQQIFSDLGLQNFNNRNISQNPEQLRSTSPKVLGAKLLFSIAFIVIVFLTSFVFGYGEFLKPYLLWIIGTQACLSLILYLRTNISGIGKYFVDSCFSVLDKSILVLIMVYLLWFNQRDIQMDLGLFIKAQFGSMLLTLFILFLYSISRIVPPKIQFDLHFIRKLLRQTLPYASLILLMAGYSRLDGVMLERLLSDDALEAGKYASAFRLYDTYNNFSFLFAVLLLPMFSRMIAKKAKLDELEKWALSLLSLGSIFIIPLVIFQGPEILSVFYTREIDISYQGSFLFLILASLPLSLNYIYGSLLTANGNLSLLNKIALGGFILNFVMNWLIIPHYGARGTALTTLITQGLVLILQIIYAYKVLELKVEYKLILKIGSISLLAILLAYMVFNIFEWKLEFGLLIYVPVFTIFAFLLKLINRDDFRVLFQRENREANPSI